MFIPSQKVLHHHLNHSVCYIISFLRQCLYTLQHIPEDGSFYLAYIQSQHLKPMLHYNARHKERLAHENSSLYVLFMFSAYHENLHISFSFYRLRCQLFKQLRLNVISGFSILKHFPVPQKH